MPVLASKFNGYNMLSVFFLALIPLILIVGALIEYGSSRSLRLRWPFRLIQVPSSAEEMEKYQSEASDYWEDVAGTSSMLRQAFEHNERIDQDRKSKAPGHNIVEKITPMEIDDVRAKFDLARARLRNWLDR